MKTQEALATMLSESGVTHFFHVPVFGHEAMKRLIRLGVTPVVAHGEKAAVYMADGYARVSGRPGVCGAQAIGGTNLAAGLRDAYLAKSPVVAFTGGPEPDTRHKNVYQEHDDMPIFDRLTKFNTVVDDGRRLPELLRQAYRAATTGAPRPVHLELYGPGGKASSAEIADDEVVIETRHTRAPALRPLADTELVKAAVELLSTARRPILLAGGGVKRSRAEATLRRFAERLQIPVVASLNGLGVLPEAHPLWAGVVGGYARDQANAAVLEADLVLVAGSALGSMTTRDYTVPGHDTTIIHIDIDPEEVGRNYRDSLPLVGDIDAVLNQLEAADAAPRQRPEWLARIAGLQREWYAEADEVELAEAPLMRPERLWRALSDALPDEAIVVGDTGHVGAWSARHLKLSEGHTFIRAAGSLGWALPASIGAKCAAPDRPVVCLTGDGGFYYHVAELETACRYDIPVVVVVNNNAGMNQEAILWEAGTDEDRNWQFTHVDLAAVGAALGCGSWVAHSGAELQQALKEAVASGRPAVIDARTDRAAMAPTIYAEAPKQS
ncbi:thiamine pyrophosphate-binding protein [Actinomadura roseirufa]|uniref:thiamine pyrophosphate-binding protein n=1 Tax=Actinomadura roseirufa TaxID=2094049 RepID=UPI0010415BFC|nr:thiamine pyrophosphate-binding protein [Actinomadura roseirufa]